MISLESSYRGFKTTLTKIKNSLEEMENPPEINITLESDTDLVEYNPQDFPTTEAIRQLFHKTEKIVGYIYVGERLKHKQILFQIERDIPKIKEEPKEEPTSFTPIVEQMKQLIKASEEIQEMKMRTINQFFAEQLKAQSDMYEKRDTVLMELKGKEMELKIKEIELNSKKKTELMESVITGVGSGLKELISWAKDNPGEIAEIYSLIKSKPAN